MFNEEEMKEYVALMAKSIPSTMNVQFGGEKRRVLMEMGICPYEKVTITHLDSYSRSIKLKVEFGDNEKELLLFVPPNKSPNKCYLELQTKIRRMINSSYTDEELEKKLSDYKERMFRNIKTK